MLICNPLEGVRLHTCLKGSLQLCAAPSTALLLQAQHRQLRHFTRDREVICSVAGKEPVARSKAVTRSRQFKGQRRKRAPVHTARLVAVQQLLRVEDEGAYVGLVGGKAGSSAPDAEDKLDPRDARMVTELVAGVTRFRRRLDYMLEAVAGRPVAQMEIEMRQILRLAVYELVQLGLPSHAISVHVDLAKALVREEAGRFANGVLRTVTRMRDEDDIPKPASPATAKDLAEKADLIGIACSHPTWLVKRWLQRFGEASTLALLRWNNARPEHGVRLTNPAEGPSVEVLLDQLAQAGVSAEASRYLPTEFIHVTAGLQKLMALGLVESGQLQIQDEAAGLVVAMLDPQPGDRILDACAAPGGKTLFAASRMRQNLPAGGRIVALDISAARLKALQSTAAAQGVGELVEVRAADLREYAAAARPPAGLEQQAGSVHSDLYDRVLVDAPCSGVGVLAKRADLRWRRSPADFKQLTALQDELLDAAAGFVKPGGLLVYSTCSIESDENEERVGRFLRKQGGFELEAAPAGLIPDSVLSEDGCLATLPHVHGIDGAFAARLRRAPEVLAV